VKGRNGGIAEDKAEKEGQGQRKGLFTLTDEDLFRKLYVQRYWKIT